MPVGDTILGSVRKRARRAPVIRLFALQCLVLFTLLFAGCGAVQTAIPVQETPVPTASLAPTSVPTPVPTPTPAPTPTPVTLTAFVPDAFTNALVRVETTIPEDSPIAILDELVRLCVLPDIDYGRAIYFEVSDSYIKIKGGKRIARVVARLDLSDRFLDALADMSEREELLCMQSLANTFLTHYRAESFMLTANGVKFVTGVRDYESGLTFDQLAKTARED